MSDRGERWFLKADGYPWLEVTREEWVQRERSCGFRPKGEDRGQPATAGFSSSLGGWRGTVTHASNHDQFRELYPDLPE